MRKYICKLIYDIFMFLCFPIAMLYTAYRLQNSMFAVAVVFAIAVGYEIYCLIDIIRIIKRLWSKEGVTDEQ